MGTELSFLIQALSHRVSLFLLFLGLLLLFKRLARSPLFLFGNFLSVQSANFLFDFSLLSFFYFLFLILLFFLYFLLSNLFLGLLEKILSKAIELALKSVLRVWHSQLGCLSEFFFICDDFLRGLKLGRLTSWWDSRLKLCLLPDRFGISFLSLQSGRCLSLHFVLLLSIIGRLWASLLLLLEDT